MGVDRGDGKDRMVLSCSYSQTEEICAGTCTDTYVDTNIYNSYL